MPHMSVGRAWIILGACWTWPFFGPVLAAQNVPDPVIRLARIRENVARNVKRMSDFTCLQSIQRSEGTRDDAFRILDKIRLEVAVAGNTEMFGWPGGDGFHSERVGHLIPVGLTTTGDYRDHLRSVFVAPGATEWTYAGQEDLGGRAVYRYDYRMSAMLSRYMIRTGLGATTAPFEGSAWVDSDSLQVLRLSVRIEGLAEVGIKRGETRIDYGRIVFADGDFMMPQRSVVALETYAGGVRWNEIAFSHFRRFQATSRLRLGGDETGKELAVVPLPLLGSRVPAGIRFAIRLTEPIDSVGGSVGDPIQAVLSSEIKAGGRIIFPKGALVTGRIRRFEAYDDPIAHRVVGIEFDEIQSDGAVSRFDAEFVGSDSLKNRMIERETMRSRKYILDGGIVDSIRDESLLHPDQPGLAIFTLKGKEFTIAPGTELTWKTVRPER